MIDIIDLKANILDDNDEIAEKTRNALKNSSTFLINLMSAPGAGKTTTVLGLLELLSPKYKIAVMEADIDSFVDAEKINNAGGTAIQLHTGGMCHLDATMTMQGLSALKYENYDIVILENVGNLVCPAEFDTGASVNMMILSVPEGDDKPLKYPLMFQISDAVIINKTDVKDYFDFDTEKAVKYINERHKGIPVFPISAKNKENLGSVAEWISQKAEEWNKR